MFLVIRVFVRLLNFKVKCVLRYNGLFISSFYYFLFVDEELGLEKLNNLARTGK